MTIKEFIQSQTFKGVLIGFILAVVMLVIFQAGVAVGMHKASYVHGLGDNFERNFRGPERMMFGVRGDAFFEDVPGGHGAFGEIVSVSLPEVIIAGPDAIEKTVLVTDDTAIREFRSSREANDLVLGMHVVVLGKPNDEGQITAALIRVLPPPPEGFLESSAASSTPNAPAQ